MKISPSGPLHITDTDPSGQVRESIVQKIRRQGTDLWWKSRLTYSGPLYKGGYAHARFTDAETGHLERLPVLITSIDHTTKILAGTLLESPQFNHGGLTYGSAVAVLLADVIGFTVSDRRGR
jgi:hypothetical protein